MNGTTSEPTSRERALDAARRIAPCWPLERFVAVNPLLGVSSQMLVDAGLHVARTRGARLTQPRDRYAAAVADGRIGDAHLAAAIAELAPWLPRGLAVSDVRSQLGRPEHPPARYQLSTVLTLAREVTGIDWPRLAIEPAHRYFAEVLARRGAPDVDGRSLYADFRERLCIDRTLELLGAHGARGVAETLPQDALETIELVAQACGVTAPGFADWCERLYADVAGWTGLLRERGWLPELAGEDPELLLEVLAVRASLELLVLRGVDDPRLEARRETAFGRYVEDDSLRWRRHRAVDHVLHRALELAERARFEEQFAQPRADATADERARAQLVFCIDVRSERLRRAIEQTAPDLETHGFAGFFGLPLSVGVGDRETSRCPVLLPASIELEHGVQQAGGVRDAVAGALQRLQSGVVGCFTAVEAFGFAHGAALLARTLAPALARAPRRPGSAAVPRVALGTEEKVEAALAMLAGMGLRGELAPVVVLAGHGAAVSNNPYAAGLECGACGGHAGDVNARAAAALLNDPAVREGLARAGHPVPADTVFVAALHETTTDAMHFYGDDLDPAELGRDVVAAAQQQLTSITADVELACEAVRCERAPSLGLRAPRNARQRAALTRRLRAKSADWAEVRPEWGLAGCTAFVAAPRSRLRGSPLGGRSFLHSYEAEHDDGDGVLETILTAPLIVASWINLQYYASTVDNQVFGSGDKTLHNVVGGVGILEGNGGDLRTGLPLQSVEDGSGPVHVPARLNAYVDASPRAMGAIIERTPMLRDLLDAGWIELNALERVGDGLRVAQRYVGGGYWQPVGDGETALTEQAA